MNTEPQRWLLPRSPDSPAVARRHITQACRGLARDLVDVTILLTSELVTNAVRYGHGQIRLHFTEDRDRVLVEVHDDGGGELTPHVVDPDPSAQNGRGLLLVEALSSEWGTTSTPDGGPGKRVWFQIRKAAQKRLVRD